MKFYIAILTLLSIYQVSVNYPIHKTQSTEHIETKRESKSKFVFIEGGIFTFGNAIASNKIRRKENDSTLLVTMPIVRRVNIKSFYINTTEVTNSEWMEFYNDKKDQLGEVQAKKKFYPDTSIWVKDYFTHGTYAKNYFSSPDYRNFPVVGITWNQANSYCKWRTNKFNKFLANQQISDTVEFRLPSEEEWEYAARYRNKPGIEKKHSTTSLISNEYIYPWEYNLPICHINSLSNIGPIYDDNSIKLKDYGDDGYIVTSKVASFPPNSQGLFDMGGNVSEWTNDPGYVYGYEILYKSNAIQKAITQIEDGTYMDLLNKWDHSMLIYADSIELKKYNKRLIENLKQDQDILDTDTKICKGGNWDNDISYCMSSARHIYKTNEASSKLGFRVALTLSNPSKSLLKYFPQQK